MSRLVTRRLRRRSCTFPLALTVLLVQPAGAVQQDKLALPPAVSSSQKQVARWTAAYVGWRGATWTWPGETEREASLRRDTRLLVVPTPAPILNTQRRLDGRAVVISVGLIALLDELLLAEIVSGLDQPAASPLAQAPEACFDHYARELLVVTDRNRGAMKAKPPEPLQAWPRLTALVDAGRAEGACKSLTSAMLRSASTQQALAASTDALALWVLTRQNLLLAALPRIEPPSWSPGLAAAGSAGLGASGPANLQQKAAPDAPKAPQSESAIEHAPVACLPEDGASASGAQDAGHRARLAVCVTGRPDLRTAQWLFHHVSFFGGDSTRQAGSAPP